MTPADAPTPRAHDTQRAPEAHDTQRAPEAHDTQRAPEAHDTQRAPEARDMTRAPEARDTQRAPETHDMLTRALTRAPETHDMTRRHLLLGPVLLPLLLVSACASQPSDTQEVTTLAAEEDATTAGPSGLAAIAVTRLEAPAPAGSAFPRLLASPDGGVLLAWLEREAATSEGEAQDDSAPVTRLRVARRDGGAGGAWSEPTTIAAGPDVLLNWADVPQLGAGDDGILAAAWTVMVPGGAHASRVVVATSSDGGTTWEAPRVVHGDDSATEHAFPSFAPRADGGLEIAWLDGRLMAASEGDGGHDGHGSGPMTLRAATISAEGELSADRLVDSSTCECCSTDAVRADDALLFAWRDRTKDETRDVAVARVEDGEWSEPRLLHADGWTIHGCPVNGPALAAGSGGVAAAWFTAPDDAAEVRVAFSDDVGATWSAPTRIDGGSPVGRASVAALPNGRFVVGWLEEGGDDARFLARVVDRSGATSAPVEIARVPTGRASGFPRLLAVDGGVLAAWTASDAEPAREGALPLRVRLARVAPTGGGSSVAEAARAP